MEIRAPYSTNLKDLQKVYDSLTGTVKASEVYIVLPCGRRPSIRCGNGDYFEWDGFRLIKKVDCEKL